MTKIVFSDFYSNTCGPCRMMLPVVEELEKEFAGKIEVRKIELDNPVNHSLIEQYQISSIPTFIIERDGQLVSQFMGMQSKNTLAEALNKAIS